MHFSENPSMVRIDRFKDTGKWYDTYAVDMKDYWHTHVNDRWNSIHNALESAIADDERFGPHWVNRWLAQGGFIVCLEPYYEHSHPITLKAMDR